MKINTHLQSADQTACFGQAFAPLLSGGSTILLSGGVGAGKTHFARSLILERLTAIEDVPSPTFTLVQTYEAQNVEIWHADLYRLSSVDEVYELGLEDAFETALCLIEWPDRLGELTPQDALEIHFELINDQSRNAVLQWQSNKWDTIVDQAIRATTNAIP